MGEEEGVELGLVVEGLGGGGGAPKRAAAGGGGGAAVVHGGGGREREREKKKKKKSVFFLGEGNGEGRCTVGIWMEYAKSGNLWVLHEGGGGT